MEITCYVRRCVNDYKEFAGIDNFPTFTIKSKEMTLSKAETQGFDAPAAAFYDAETGLHILEIWSKLYLPQMNARYLVFHELTHILDDEIYSRKDKMKHMSNKGYTEYHAAHGSSVTSEFKKESEFALALKIISLSTVLLI